MVSSVAKLSWGRASAPIVAEYRHACEFLSALWLTLHFCANILTVSREKAEAQNLATRFLNLIDFTFIVRLLDARTLNILLLTCKFLSKVGLAILIYAVAKSALSTQNSPKLASILCIHPFVAPYALRVLLIASTGAVSPSQVVLAWVMIIAYSGLWIACTGLLRDISNIIGYRLNRLFGVYTVVFFVGQTISLLVYISYFSEQAPLRNGIIFLSLASSLLGLYIKLEQHEYVSHSLEYLNLMCFVVQSLVALMVLLLRDTAPTTSKQLIAVAFPCVIAMTLHQIGFLKMLIQRKYLRVMRNLDIIKQPEELVILAELLLLNKPPSAFQVDLPSLVVPTEAALVMIRSKYIPADKQDNDYVLRYLIQQSDRSDMQLFGIFLVGVLLREWDYLQAIRLFNKLTENRKNWRIELELLEIQLSDFLRHSGRIRKSETPKPKLLCCRFGSGDSLDIRRILESEKVILSLIGLVDGFLDIKARLLQAQVQRSEDQLSLSESLAFDLEKRRAEIDQFLTLHKQYKAEKRFAAAYYIFLRSGCRLHFSIPQLMKKCIDLTEIKALQSTTSEYKQDLVCLVSGENDIIGTILNANIAMKEYAGVSSKKLQMKTQKIECLLPDVLIKKHHELMLRFNRTGVPNIIGQTRDLFLVCDNTPSLARTSIKVLPSLDGPVFSGCFRLLHNQTEYILLNSMPKQTQFNVKQLYRGNRPEYQPPAQLERQLREQQRRRAKSISSLTFVPKLDIRMQCIHMEEIKLWISCVRNLFPTLSAGSRHSTETGESISKLRRPNTDPKARKYEENVQRLQPHNLMPWRLWKLAGCFCILLAVVLGGAVVFHLFIDTLIRQIGSFYMNLVEGVRIKNYYISGRTELINSVVKGSLDDAALIAKGIPSLLAFFSTTQNMLISSIAGIERIMVDVKPNIWKFQKHLLNPIFPYFGITNINMLEYFSIVKSYSYEFMTLYSSQIANNYPSLTTFNNWMTSVTATAIKNSVNTPFKSTTVDYLSVAVRVFIWVAIGVIFSIAVALALVILELKRVHAIKERQLALLASLPEQLYANCADDCKKSRRFLDVRILLRQLLKKHSITRGSSTINTGQMEFVLSTNAKWRIQSNQGDQKALSEHGGCPLPPRSFVKSEKAVLALLFFGFMISSITIWQSLNSHSDSVANLSYYYDYMDNSFLLRTSQAGLTDILVQDVILFRKSLLATGSLTQTQLQTRDAYLSALRNRTLDDVNVALTQVLKRKLPWPEVEAMLYSPICSKNDTVCGSLLNGAMKSDMPSTLTTFSNFLLFLTEPRNSTDLASLSETKKRTAEIFVATMEYIQPKLKIVHRHALDILLADMEASHSSYVRLLAGVFVPLVALVTILMLPLFWRSRFHLYYITRQCLTYTQIKLGQMMPYDSLKYRASIRRQPT